MCLILGTDYKITDDNLKKIWLIISNDNFVCKENLNAVLKTAQKNGIDSQSISFFNNAKFSLDEFEDLASTVSFFGERLIVITDFDLAELTDEYIDKICQVIENSQGTYFAIALYSQDGKTPNLKKFAKLKELAQSQGLLHIVDRIDDKYLSDMIVKKAKSLDCSVDKQTAMYIIQCVGRDIGLLQNETEKYAAYCNYTVIDKEVVDLVGVKTLEAKIFDVIGYICDKKAIKALETINTLYALGTDEIAVLGALASSFIDMYRCKIAKKKGVSIQQVHSDFEKKSNIYRYQKALANSNKFSEKSLEEILSLMLSCDLALKSSGIDKRQIIDSLVTQIIVKGNAV